MRTITLRDIPSEVRRLIERTAAESGLSLNRTVIRLLRERLEREEGRQEQVFHDLDHLAGAWSPEEAAEFERSLADQRAIDSELWQ